MIFKGIDNQSVELKIVNYQFPEIIDDEWDSNWLNVFINVKSKMGHWQTVDPSLDTSDLSSMISWFNRLSLDGEVEYKELGFTEPNLTFELIESDRLLKRIRIRFELESRPKSATDDREYYVDCDFSNEELKNISQELEKELEKFPCRKWHQ